MTNLDQQMTERALEYARAVNAKHLLQTALAETGKVIEYFERMNRMDMDAALQTSFEVEVLQEEVPQWVQDLFEALIERVPKRERAHRISEPYAGWQSQIYPSDIAKWKGFNGRTTAEIKAAMERYSHPRLQFVRPGRLLLCRIRDAA